MKGLIYKDWCQANYIRFFFIWPIFVVALSFFSSVDSGFYCAYFFLILGMFPGSLYSLDEKEGWCRYSATMSVSRSQYITAKYLFGLLLTLAGVAACGICLVAEGLIRQNLAVQNVFSQAAAWIAVGSAVTAVTMPFQVRFGAERGNIVRLIALACVSVAIMIGKDWLLGLLPSILWGGVAAAAALFVGLYILSWRLSIFFYKKRDL